VSLRACFFAASLLLLAVVVAGMVAASESPEVEPLTPQTVAPGPVVFEGDTND
jgi:hypothetical protein